MMLGKLAFRNVKRQISSYIVYFITVVFTVALMFAVNNILLNKELLEMLTYDIEDMTGLLGIPTALVTLVSGFIICYATVFLLRKRKKELGTYLLLGITRSAVLRIFILENLIIGSASFMLGVAAGTGVFKALDAVVRSLIGREYLAPLGFAPASLWLTLLQWAVIFFAAVLYSGIVLGKTKIAGLVNAKTVKKNLPKHTNIEKILAFFSLAVMIAAVTGAVLLLLDSWIFYMFGDPHFEIMEYVVYIGILICVAMAAVIAFHFFIRSFYAERLKSKKASRGSNTFHYRQMSGSLNRNALMMGLIAVLMSFAVMFTNMAFSSHYTLVEELNDIAPFDVSAGWRYERYEWEEDEPPVFELTPEQVIAYAEEKAGISFMLQYNLYRPDWTGSGFDGDAGYNRMRVLKKSDANALMRHFGSPELEFSDDEFIVFGQNVGALAAGAPAVLYGVPLTAKSAPEATGDMRGGLSYFDGYSFSAVVPDRLLPEGASDAYRTNTGLQINTKKFLPSDLFKTVLKDGWWGRFESRDVKVYSKYAELAAHYAQSSISVIGSLFLGVAFMFFAMALLSLKMMSDADLDKKRYKILNMLGVGASGQRKIMLRQILAFFAVPLLIPCLFLIPSVLLSALLSKQIIGHVHAGIYWIAAAVPLVFGFIFAAYFAATYYLSVKNGITPIEKPRVKLLKQ